MTNIFDLVSGGSVVVAGSEEYAVVVTWNGSATFQLVASTYNGMYDVIDVATCYGIETLEDARNQADVFLGSYIAEIEFAALEMDAA